MNRTHMSRNLLIAFALAAACPFGAPASAATIVVLHRSLPPEVRVSGTSFDVDEQRGRVRLAVDLYDDSWEGNVTTESVSVPGLRFDRERREVLYESEGSVVRCARRRTILWGTSYPATEACRITVRSEPLAADADATRALTDWVVEFAAGEPTRSAALSR